jgi:hypothetical protein
MSCSIALRRSPKPGRLDGGGVERAPDLVDHQGGEGFTLDVLGDDHERLAGLHHGLERRQHGLDSRDLGAVEQDVGVFEDDFLALGVGDEVRRQVALVELHALGEVELGAERVRLLDGDDAVLADLVDGVGDDLADRAVGGGDGGDAGDVGLVVDVLGLLGDRLDRRGDGLLDALLDRHRVGAGGDVLHAGRDHCLGEHGGGRGAVTGDVVGLRRHFLDELGTHVLERVLELDLLGDRHTVVGDRRRAELLVEHDVATLGADRDADGVSELVDSGFEGAARLVVELQYFCHWGFLSGFRMVGSDLTSLARQFSSRRSRARRGC